MRDQKPPLNQTQRIEVSRGETYDYTPDALVRYQRRSDGWYVRTPADDEYWRFAAPAARDLDVRQLLRKKWSVDYGVPDAFDDRS